MSVIETGHIEAAEKLTAKVYFKPTGEEGFISLGNVVDYKDASEVQYRTRMKSENGFRVVNDEQADTIHRKWEFTLDEVTGLVEEIMSLGESSGTLTKAAVASITISSLTQTTGTATADTATNHGLTTGDQVLISGATQAGYNGLKTVTVTDANTFTFAVDSGTVTPATGTPILRKTFLKITAATLGRTYFVGRAGVSGVVVYKQSNMSVVASSNYVVDAARGSVTINLTASGVTAGDALVIAFTASEREYEVTEAQTEPLRQGTFLILEVSQHSKEALRRTSFSGCLSVASRATQSGEFGKFVLRATPTADPTILWRHARV